MTMKEELLQLKSNLAALKDRIEADDQEAIAEGEKLRGEIETKSAAIEAAQKKADLLNVIGKKEEDDNMEEKKMPQTLGENFVEAVKTANIGKRFDTLRVVNDQIGTPTYTYDLSRLLVDMIETEKYGYYHATNEGGYISWYDFACEIVRLGGVDATVSPCTTAEYPTPAKRPAWSALENMALAATVGNDARPWQQALASFFEHWDGN